MGRTRPQDPVITIAQPIRARRRAQRAAVLVALLLALPAVGCGGDDYANDPPPAAVVVASAAIGPERITVSPSRFGAGIVELVVTNQSPTSQQLQLRSEQLAPGGTRLAQRTGPINPGATAALKANLDEGTYLVSALSQRVEPAMIVVDSRRPAGRDRLLQP